MDKTGRSCNRCCSGKTISIKYSECVFVALVTQHASRIHSIIVTSVACLTLQYFSILSHTQQDFRGGKKSLNTKCVF